LDYARRGVAEFIGTFALIFIGATASIYNDQTIAAFGNGLVIAVMVSAFAGISGGHFNPAVTMGFFVTRRITVPFAFFYWVVQFGAAALAALLLKWILPSQVKAAHYGAPSVNNVIDAGKAVTIEAVCVFFLVIVVFATAVDAKGAFAQIAGLAIGFTIVFGVLMAGPLTGGALNPARAFGPELVANYWTNAWVYYVGPFAGGALAAILYEVLYLSHRPSGEEEPAEIEPEHEHEYEPEPEHGPGPGPGPEPAA
jgi:MIP family channel proteins